MPGHQETARLNPAGIQIKSRWATDRQGAQSRSVAQFRTDSAYFAYTPPPNIQNSLPTCPYAFLPQCETALYVDSILLPFLVNTTPSYVLFLSDTKHLFVPHKNLLPTLTTSS